MSQILVGGFVPFISLGIVRRQALPQRREQRPWPIDIFSIGFMVVSCRQIPGAWNKRINIIALKISVRLRRYKLLLVQLLLYNIATNRYNKFLRNHS